MNISYNWLKNYIEINEDLESLSSVLTQIGLEVGSIEEFCSIEGGLEGLVTGKVLTCEKHPNADKLSITTVDVGASEVLNIVCGAPNVAAGQNVIVATIGTTLYTADGSFKIKKSKIRGEVSEGMICAEDEIGVGTSHAGIMVLPDEIEIGLLAANYFKIENDNIFEIDLTPNRVDAASHIGVARDLAAYYNKPYTLPNVDLPELTSEGFKIDIKVENADACPRYMGICMDNIRVCESPEWLKNKLKSIGLNPINNIVDITNFVLHETGHPLHAFDGDKILGNKIIVKTVTHGSSFTTLDEIERKLTTKDLMICNAKESMCIAGVFGGIDSGITEKTKQIFIESAYFNPVWVRRTAKTHSISTDSSFRFERGADVNMAPYALKRAAKLISELGFGDISSEIIDIYTKKIEPKKVNFNFNNCANLIGYQIKKETILRILKSLKINILEEKGNDLLLEIPTYRVDVYREADVIEEILRIYGYNNIPIPEKIEISINKLHKPDNEKLTDTISEMLVSQGFNEIMCNSLISDKYFEDKDKHNNIVRLHNPLSKDLGIMRPSLIFGGLESIQYNLNRKNQDLKFFEFGRSYHSNPDISDISNISKYSENKLLGIWITGKKNQLNWNLKDTKSDFFYLKSFVNNIFNKLGIKIDDIDFEICNDDKFAISQKYHSNDKTLLQIGILSKKTTNLLDIDQEVFFAEINWELILELIANIQTKYIPVSKFPAVKRDLALLIDKNISYNKLRDIAFKAIGPNLKKVGLFDVYEGKNLETGKVSYALSFLLEDKNKTMTDSQIEKIMRRLIHSYEEIGAKIR